MAGTPKKSSGDQETTGQAEIAPGLDLARIRVPTPQGASDAPITDEEAVVLVRGFAALRRPFDQVEKLRKSWTDDAGDKKSVVLDYVGHAQVTHRLLEVDPLYSWEPKSRDENENMIVTQHGKEYVLEIWLTVLGKRVEGVGNATLRGSYGNMLKELIGDAIRNASMRLGVALDLWMKIDIADMDRASDSEAREVDEVVDRTRLTNAAKTQVLRILRAHRDQDVTMEEAAGLWASTLEALGLDPADEQVVGDGGLVNRVAAKAKEVVAKLPKNGDAKPDEGKTVPPPDDKTPVSYRQRALASLASMFDLDTDQGVEDRDAYFELLVGKAGITDAENAEWTNQDFDAFIAAKEKAEA